MNADAQGDLINIGQYLYLSSIGLGVFNPEPPPRGYGAEKGVQGASVIHLGKTL